MTSAARRPVARKAGARITEHRLGNGLTVLLAERHSDPVVAVMLWYRVGSRDEEEREAGVSHFLEHMMFKGSRRFGKGEIDRVTTALGGSNNAFTSSDHTAYWFEFASDRWEKRSRSRRTACGTCSSIRPSSRRRRKWCSRSSRWGTTTPGGRSRARCSWPSSGATPTAGR
jgi:hypothetical protein